MLNILNSTVLSFNSVSLFYPTSVSALFWGKAALVVTSAEHKIYQADLRWLKDAVDFVYI